MNRICSPAGACLGAALFFVMNSNGQEKPAPQTAGTFEIQQKRSLRYLIALPEGYGRSEEKWPLLVFLHGAGERGDDLEKVKVHGPPKLVAEGRKLPFLLVSPQCPSESWWTYEPVPELIDRIEQDYRVDPDRIYLTGLSMGGYGVWSFAARQPRRYAAIVPICGGGIPYLMRSLAHLPIWVFHGEKDPAVPLEESDRLVRMLRSIGNNQIRFTVYPDTGHDSWTPAYAMDELFAWMLEQKRKALP
jgi:predicted peptidase